MSLANPSDVIRFAKFIVVRLDGCWQWTGCIDKGGYARFRWNGETRNAMHFALLLVNKAVSKGLEPDHLCRNRSCVYPKHLEIVTKRENIMRGNWTCAVNARKTHCKRGHPFDETNTLNTYGWRECKTCINGRRRKARVVDPEKFRSKERANYYKHREKRLEYARKRRGEIRTTTRST